MGQIWIFRPFDLFSFFMRNNPWNQTGDENEKGAPAL